MGAGSCFKEFGKDFDNTICTSDLVSLSLIKLKPKKITHIRIWKDDYITGFETYYDGVSAGARFGSGFTKSSFVDIVLLQNEFVTQVNGTSKEIIDTLTICTSLGRYFTVGTNKGGRNFSLNCPQKVIIGFKVGFGKYLHKIGVFFGKSRVNYSARRSYSNHQFSIPRYNENISNQRLVQNNRLYQDSNYQNFASSNSFSQQFNTTRSRQMPARMHNHYTPYSPHSIREDDSSSTSSQVVIPSQIRESIAKRARRCQSVIERGRGSGYYTMADNEEEKALFSPKKLNPCGIKYTNTILFDDYESLAKGCTNITIKQLRVIHDHHYIYGVQSVYEIDGKICSSAPHCLTNIPPFAINESIILIDGEVITSIEGTYVDVVNGIQITTSKGLIYKFGITDFSLSRIKSFKATVPHGKRMIAIYGGFNSYLHNISFYYV